MAERVEHRQVERQRLPAGRARRHDRVALVGGGERVGLVRVEAVTPGAIERLAQLVVQALGHRLGERLLGAFLGPRDQLLALTAVENRLPGHLLAGDGHPVRHSTCGVIRSFEHAEFPLELLLERKRAIALRGAARAGGGRHGGADRGAHPVAGGPRGPGARGGCRLERTEPPMWPQRAGAEVRSAGVELLPELGPVLGKGDALYRSLAAVTRRPGAVHRRRHARLRAAVRDRPGRAR